MDWLIPIGRVFFALALLGLGVEHFVFREFVTANAPAWPDAFPGGWVWAYLTGTVLIATSGTLFVGKKARLAALLMAGLVFLWALLRQIPPVAASPLFSVEWTHASKGLRFVGGMLAIAATSPPVGGGNDTLLSRWVNRRSALIVVARALIGPSLIINGIQHFLFTEFVAGLIPEWFPGDAVVWTYFGGLALIAGGLGLLLPRTAALAALLSGAMVFSWFWIIHIPRALPTPVSRNDAVSVLGALAVSGALFVIAGSLYARGESPQRTPDPLPVQ